MSILIDSYASTNYNDDYPLTVSGWYVAAGQAITLARAGVITSVKFWGVKVNSATGNVYAKLYASTGTVGVNAKPTGSALATSAAVSASSFPGTHGWVEFTFASPAYFASAGDICLVCYYGGGNSSNYVEIGRDTSSPTHGGNAFYTTDGATWAGNTDGYDTIFELYGGYPRTTCSMIM